MKFPSADLTGKVAIVTGGGKGLGFAMAEGLAHAGADIVITSRNLEQCRVAAEHIRKIKGNRAIAISCDVTSPQSVNEMVEQVVREMGEINILVNNAGMNIRKPALEVSDSDWLTVINTNLTGVFYVARKVGQQMVKQGKGGKVINIASVIPEFKTNFSRKEHQPQIDAIVEKWTTQYTTAELEKMLDAAGVPVSRIKTVEQLCEDPHIKHRNMLVELEHPVLGKVKYPGNPINLSETPVKVNRRAPLLGEHNNEILNGLGYSDSDIARLKEEKVI